MSKRWALTATGILIAFIMAGCAASPTAKETKEVKDVKESPQNTMTVNKDITEEQIKEFYYTIENINYDAYYLRYKFYTEEGKHMFFFEERERPDDYGPTSEEDTIAKTQFELSDNEWSDFYETISGGEVRARNEDPVDGDSGPWTYLYWSGDEDKYQEYSFKSSQNRADFEKLCESLVKKSGTPMKSEEEMKNIPDDPRDVFEKYYKEEYDVASKKESFVTERGEDGIYFTAYPEALFGAIGHYIGDLDDDDEDEMLVIGLGQEDDNEYLWLTVYEYEDGKAVLTGTYEYGEKVLEADGGKTFVFLYRDSNYPVIAIMTEDYYYTRADGSDIRFVALNYGDNDLAEAAMYDYTGSDMEDNGFAKNLKRYGIEITWDDLFEDGLQGKVLKSCNGRLLAEYSIVLDKEEDEDYMPVKLYRHVEIR